MSEQASYPKVAQLRSVAELRARLQELGLELPVDEVCQTAAAGSPLAEPLEVGGFPVGNPGVSTRWRVGTPIAMAAPANTHSAAGDALG